MSELPRVLLCSFDVIPAASALSRRVSEYLKALSDHYQVVVLSTKTQDVSHIERFIGSRLLRVPVGGGDFASRLHAFERAVRRQLESEEYALVHVTDPFGGHALSELKAQYGYRLVYEASSFPSLELLSLHPQLDADKKLLSRVRRQELYCLVNAERVITSSEVGRRYVQSLGVNDSLIRVLRTPADLSAYEANPAPPPDRTPMRLMYLGSELSWQGLPALIHAVSIAARTVDVRLAIVGPRHPDYHARIEELTRELGLTERVELKAPCHHDELPKVLALADVCVAPLSDAERNLRQGGSLSKVSEYLAAGRPIIAADMPITRELCPEDGTVFYPPNDSEVLAQRIVELAQSPSRRVELGKRAAAFAARAVDGLDVQAKLLELYEELIGKTDASGRPEPIQPTLTGTPTGRMPLAQPSAVSAKRQERTEPNPPAARPEKSTPDARSSPVRAEARLDADAEPTHAAPPPTGARIEPRAASQNEGRAVPAWLGKSEPDARVPSRTVEAEVRGVPAWLGSRGDTDPHALAAQSPATTDASGAPSVERTRGADTVSAVNGKGEAPPRIPTSPLSSRPVASEARNEPASSLEDTELRAPPLSPSTPSRSGGGDPRRADAPATSSPPSIPNRNAEASSRIPVAKQNRRDTAAEAEPPGAQAVAPAPPQGRKQTSPIAPALAPLPSPVTASALPAPDATRSPVVTSPLVALPRALRRARGEEPDEISADEIMEFNEISLVSRLTRIDPWFAQLVHGYCPPDGIQFARPTPPTNFPGRDELAQAAGPASSAPKSPAE